MEPIVSSLAIFADEVLTEVANQMADLLKDIQAEKKSFEKLGITYEEKAFYDILKAIAKQFGFDYPEDKLLILSAELKMDLILILAEHDYPPVSNDEVFKEIF